MKTWLTIVALASLGVANPPTIGSVSPATPTRSDQPQTLTVNGTDFEDGLKLMVTGPGGEIRTFSGQDIQSRRETSFQATLTFLASGTYSLMVLNPDGSKSNPFALQVQSGGTRPIIDQVTPAETPKDTREQAVTISGSHFAQGATVSLTGPAGSTSTIRTLEKNTPQTIVVRLMLDQAGTYSLAVLNPGGEPSNAVTLKVN